MTVHKWLFVALVAGTSYTAAQTHGAPASPPPAPAGTTAGGAKSANAEPTELTATREQNEKQWKDLQARAMTASSKRSAQYATDLKTLGNQAAATGNLDAVLAIKAEREAYEGGAVTGGFDAKSAAPQAARQLRAAYDADQDKISKYVASEGRNINLAYIRQLEDLERKLTIAGNLDGALTVRAERVSTQSTLGNAPSATAGTPASGRPAESAQHAVSNAGSAIPAYDFNSAVANYKAQEDAISSEIKPKLTSLESKYKTDLQALIDKLNQNKHTQEADKVKAEVKRFEERGLDSEPAKNTLPEIRSLYSAYAREVATVTQSVAIKHSGVRSKFSQALTTLEIGYRNTNDTTGLAAVNRARSTLTIANALDGNRMAPTEFTGKGSDPWQDVAKDGGYIVGFKYGGGGWFQFRVLGALTPIFATADGTREGQKRGKHDASETVMAKDGYAVGGIVARGGDVVNCIQVIFMKINMDGVSLNPQDFYMSEWMGGQGGGKPKEINARGHMIVGLTGTSGNEVDSLGLIYLR